MNELKVKARAEVLVHRLHRIQTGAVKADGPRVIADFVDLVSALIGEIFTNEEMAEIMRIM